MSVHKAFLSPTQRRGPAFDACQASLFDSFGTGVVTEGPWLAPRP